MEEEEFLDTMVSVKNELVDDHHYVCHMLRWTFNDYIVSEYYTAIINGHDDSCSGMFCKTDSSNTEWWNAMLLSLEIFEKVMLEEKLYLKL